MYELLSTDALGSPLNDNESRLQPIFTNIADEDSPDVLSRHVAAAIRKALAAAKPADRVGLANRLLQQLDTTDRMSRAPELESLHRLNIPKRRQLRQPTTRLIDSALFTNSKDEPNLAAELRAEMESADTVDLLCAFNRWTV